jgi:hypothetical protein
MDLWIGMDEVDDLEINEKRNNDYNDFSVKSLFEPKN